MSENEIIAIIRDILKQHGIKKIEINEIKTGSKRREIRISYRGWRHSENQIWNYLFEVDEFDLLCQQLHIDIDVIANGIGYSDY